MAYNSSGTFSRLFDWTDDRDNGIKIRADRFDQELDGFATGLTTSLLKDGTQTATAKIPFAVGLSVIDNQTVLLGTNSDIAIQYDESTNDSLEIAANVEGAALGIVLKADQGDDNADQHKLTIADGGTLTLGSKISGSFVTYLTHTPNSTVASSTTAVAGNLTVGGSFTLGSGAVLSEAELEMLDGITAGTVIASKALVADANIDITGGRNITITGELDAATGDFSGDVDVDGTLEADAITVNGTALATVIAGTTVTNATNSAHVSVADNESTNEENLIPFIEDASATGNVGLESDGDFAYNPSTGTVSATVFKGNIDAVDGDFDGTLEADAITLDGTAITATATLDTGISNNNVPKFTSGVADDDFLRVNGTAIEGRSASEVLSDIGASAVAGSSSIVTTGALNAGSITSGFGTIDTGSSNITSTGVGAFGSLDISGNIDVDGTSNLDVVDIDGAVDMASTLAVGGVVTANAGVVVDNMTLDGNTLSVTSSDFIIDATHDIILDAAGNEIKFQDNGTLIGFITLDNTDITLKTSVSDRDIIFQGNDGGSTITALSLDMSSAGDAHFNQDIYVRNIYGNNDANTGIQWEGSDTLTFHAGGVENIQLVSNAIVFNQDSADMDFRVEGNGDATLFFCDGGADKVCIGTDSPDGFFKIEKNYQSDVAMTFNDTSGSGGTAVRFKVNGSTKGEISFNTSNTTYSTSSDYRLKENVSYTFDATTRLKQLKPARFNWIADDTNTSQDGFLAHEVSSVVPEAVVGTKDKTQDIGTITDANGDVRQENVPEAVKENSEHTWTKTGTENVYQGIDQSKLVPLLVKTIQELEARIKALESA